MTNSKSLAGLIGPALVAIILSENPFVNPHLYDRQIPPLVYLSGTLLFIAGLAIARAHNRWTGWPVLVTLVGWAGMLVGLMRMFGPGLYERNYTGTNPVVLGVEATLLVVGVFLTFKAYVSKS